MIERLVTERETKHPEAEFIEGTATVCRIQDGEGYTPIPEESRWITQK